MSISIDNFVSNYVREFDFYQHAARLCAERCEGLLVANGIRAMVTFRAKRPDRLKDKLMRRDESRVTKGGAAYASHEEIRHDVVDLSGVRIALYFPGDRDRVAAIVGTEFSNAEEKRFPPPGHGPALGKRFSGYYATHLRLTYSDPSEDDARARYAGTRIEVQIASVLMHAWSEVEHDLTYKPLTGPLSENEDAILDELNGLVITGEIALDRLQKAVEVRVNSPDAKFSNRYELAAFLFERRRNSAIDGEADPQMGDVGPLLWLLQQAELDTPSRLEPYVARLDQNTDFRPIADQVSDAVLFEHPKFAKNLRAQRTPLEVSLYPGKLTSLYEPNLIGEFLDEWHVIERFGRILQRKRGNTRYGVLNAREMARLLSADSQLTERLGWIWNLRNEAVHGRRRISAYDLEEVRRELRNIVAELEASDDVDIREAIDAALQGEDS